MKKNNEKIDLTPKEKKNDNSINLRPKSLENFIGQNNLKLNLKTYIDSSKKGRKILITSYSMDLLG